MQDSQNTLFPFFVFPNNQSSQETNFPKLLFPIGNSPNVKVPNAQNHYFSPCRLQQKLRTKKGTEYWHSVLKDECKGTAITKIENATIIGIRAPSSSQESIRLAV